MDNTALHYLLLIGITIISALLLAFILRKILGIFIKKYAIKLKADPTNFSFIKN